MVKILEKDTNYIQQCLHCGAILEYSESDIQVAHIPFYAKDGTQWLSHNDAIICPSCNFIVNVEREWSYKIKLIKKLLEKL